MTFAEATAVRPRQPGRFDADVFPDWALAGRAHGGYLLALAGRAAAALATQPHVVCATGSYLSAPTPGPVTVEVDVVRSGRTMTHLRTRIAQDDQVCLDGLVIVATLAEDSKPDWTSESTAEPGTADWDESIRVPPMNPHGMHAPLFEQIDLRIEPATSGYMDHRPGGIGEIRGTLELLNNEPPDAITALFALDLLPPSVFDILQPSGWVPTLSLTAYVRALPAPGRLRLTQTVGFIENAAFDETAYVWDSTGRLIAQGTQLAAIRMP